MSDQELLREFVHSRSSKAFGKLVDRHLGMIYSAALRRFPEPRRAEEIAQRVFTALARKAASIGPSEILAGWLFDTLLRVAQEAAGGDTTIARQAGHDAETFRVVDRLPAVIGELDSRDRAGLVLRYFENRHLREVGTELGITEDGARTHVSHALERLRALFAKQGMNVSAVVLSSILSSECAAPVPTGIGIVISTAALEAAGPATADAVAPPASGAFNQRAALAMLAVALLSGGIVFFLQQLKVSTLQADIQRLLADKRRLQSENEMNAAAARGGSGELVRLRRSSDELLRLRKEVAALRKQTQGTNQPPVAPEPAAAEPAAAVTPEPGSFISRDQLAFVGFNSPQAAMESVTWATMTGNYDTFMTALNPDDRAEELRNPDSRELFESGRQKLSAQFRGMQILAMKVISEEEVEMKISMDYSPSVIQIQPLVRINSQWRLADSTREWESEWDDEGQIQKYAP